tara:strand:+ start:8872 stop:9903 length:1032 start_codon:yes stop_codon:yes gene_type:complete
MKKIYEFLGLEKPITGDIGIEVEMEGRQLPDRVPRYWRVEGDGSLRNGGLEYVLKAPVNRGREERALKHLWSTFSATEATLTPNSRCSVHIHINVQEFTKKQVFNFICLYLMAEDALVRWCGDGREGNLFCLRAKDAEYIINKLERTMHSDGIRELRSDRIRYAALNCKALTEYGSLEFRAMRGPDNYGDILTWINFLWCIREYALKADCPASLVNGFSEGGEDLFCREVFGEHFDTLFNYEGWDKEVYGGVRRCQVLAYEKDWSKDGEEEGLHDGIEGDWELKRAPEEGAVGLRSARRKARVAEMSAEYRALREHGSPLMAAEARARHKKELEKWDILNPRV